MNELDQKCNQQENQLQVTDDGFKSRFPLSPLRPGVDIYSANNGLSCTSATLS